jgi:hypothetical protein
MMLVAIISLRSTLKDRSNWGDNLRVLVFLEPKKRATSVSSTRVDPPIPSARVSRAPVEDGLLGQVGSLENTIN